jgi:hypothetical protein
VISNKTAEKIKKIKPRWDEQRVRTIHTKLFRDTQFNTAKEKKKKRGERPGVVGKRESMGTCMHPKCRRKKKKKKDGTTWWIEYGDDDRK